MNLLSRKRLWKFSNIFRAEANQPCERSSLRNAQTRCSMIKSNPIFSMLPGKRCVYFLHHVAKTKVSFLVRFVDLLCFFVRLEFLMKKKCLDKNEWATFLQNFWHKLRKLICKLHGKCNAYLAKYSKNGFFKHFLKLISLSSFIPCFQNLFSIFFEQIYNFIVITPAC